MILLFAKTSVIIFFLLMVSYVGKAQCPFQLTDTSCGNISPSINIPTNVYCPGSIIQIGVHTAIPTDRVEICFGDGTDTVIQNINHNDSFTVYHLYTLPSDNCPVYNAPNYVPYVEFLVNGNFYINCNGGHQSVATSPYVPVAFQFKPHVKFPGHNYAFCEGNCFTIPIDSTSCTNSNNGGGSTTYNWTYGDGASGSVPNAPADATNYQVPPHCYAEGNWTFTLTAYNQCGSEHDSLNIHVQQIDSIRLSSSGQLCTGSQISYHLYGNSGGVSNTNFVTSVVPDTGVTISGNPNSPNILFNIAGSYTISFGYGACDTPLQVTVHAGVNMDTTSIQNFCALNNPGLVLSHYFTNPADSQTNSFSVINSSGDVIFQNTSSGVPSTAIPLTDTGTYKVIDTSVTTCNTKVFKEMFTVLIPTVLSLPPDDTLCLQSTYQPPSYPATILTFDNSPVAAGTVFYIDSLRTYSFVYTPQCGNPATLHLTSKGVKAHGLDTSVCFGAGSISLYGMPPGGAFSGSDISNNTFTGSVAGTYPYTYTYYDSLSGCTYVDTPSISIYPQMQISFTQTDTVCAGNPMTFTNADATQNNTIAFGDGLTRSGYGTIHHTYQNSGFYHDTITITNNITGCSQVRYDSILVLSQPNAQFTLPDSIFCDNALIAPLLDSFNSQSHYVWTVGADTLSTLSNPTIQFRDTTDSIEHEILTLTVAAPPCGITSTSQNITLLPKTVARFGQKNHLNCSPVQDTLSNNSRGYELTYLWKLNNDSLTTDTVHAPLSLLATPDGRDSTYIITLIACSVTCGCDTQTQGIVVHPVNFHTCLNTENSTVCQGQPIVFTDPCNESDCTITYNYGDGDSSQTNGGSPGTHIYLQVNTFTVWLTANCECNIGSATLNIVVLPSPTVAPVVSNPVCSNNEAHFASQTLIGIPAFFEWSFGDGGFDESRADTVHSYTSPGTYGGWLLAKGANGCPSDTARFTAVALPLPSVTFTGDTAVCQYAQLKISVDSPIANATYMWNVVGPSDTELVTPNFSSFMFNTADTGTFTISLEAFANATPQCTAYSGTNEVTVLQSPDASFTISPIRTTINAPVSFQNFSTHALSYWWNFGVDTMSVYETNPFYQYAIPGIYPVMLTAVNGFCKDTLIKSVIIDPVLDLFIPNVITANNDGNNDYFQLYGNLEAITIFDVKIFDRIGEKVFESSDVNFKWGATYDEKNVGPAVFVYEIHMGLLGGNPGEVKTYRGSITVLR